MFKNVFIFVAFLTLLIISIFTDTAGLIGGGFSRLKNPGDYWFFVGFFCVVIILSLYNIVSLIKSKKKDKGDES